MDNFGPAGQKEEEKEQHRIAMRKASLIGLLILGLLIFMYPAVSNRWNEYRCRNTIGEYESSIATTDSTELDAIWKNARAYNKKRTCNVIVDAFADEKQETATEYNAQLDPSGNGVMGYIDIPRIGQRLPIYHGTSDESLEKGCGHLEGSSLPVGGKSTHSVISGHRGLPSAKLFTDLDRISKGDHFNLHILDRVLAYKVDKIQVVLPEETEALQIEEGRDLVTLVTCTPYGVNSHRLLVRGHRVKYVEETAQLERPAADIDNILIAAAAVLAILLAVIVRKLMKERRK